MTLRIELREGRASDVAVIASTWVESQRIARPYIDVPKGRYMRGIRVVVGALLSRAAVVVAADPDELDHVLGYAVHDIEPFALHYVYVKPAYRHAHIARRLILSIRPQFGVEKTLVTHVCGPLDKRHGPRTFLHLATRYRLEFDPFALFTVREPQQRNAAA